MKLKCFEKVLRKGQVTKIYSLAIEKTLSDQSGMNFVVSCYIVQRVDRFIRKLASVLFSISEANSPRAATSEPIYFCNQIQSSNLLE